MFLFILFYFFLKIKNCRALEVLKLKGRKWSDILSEQQKSEGGNTSGGGLRFTDNALVLWVQCEQVSNWKIIILRILRIS